MIIKLEGAGKSGQDVFVPIQAIQYIEGYRHKEVNDCTLHLTGGKKILIHEPIQKIIRRIKREMINFEIKLKEALK